MNPFTFNFSEYSHGNKIWPLQPLSMDIFDNNFGINSLVALPPQAPISKEKRNEKRLQSVQLQSKPQVHFQTILNPTNFQPHIYNTQQYFPWHNEFFNIPFTLPTHAFPAVKQLELVPQFFNGNTMLSAPTTTIKPDKRKDREPTTKRPTHAIFNAQPPKLQVDVELIERNSKNDINLSTGIRKINSDFSEEEMKTVPEHSLSKSKSTSRHLTKKSKRKPLKNAKSVSADGSVVKVEAIGKTSTTGNIPQISFDAYFPMSYFSHADKANEKTAALILEPHSKAVVGNGGTAISMPLSKAFLKRGVTTNVYFNPDSVAIAGVGGKAHAQADLELDLIN
uniref:DUF4774 domain-containing protein n=1 Tax=Glossina austeni TaxID=7395 RepID=A0A1A9VJ80_GLOAU